jgi:hypothetical protein
MQFMWAALFTRYPERLLLPEKEKDQFSTLPVALLWSLTAQIRVASSGEPKNRRAKISVSGLTGKSEA